MVTSVARLAVREEQGVFSQRVSVRAALLVFGVVPGGGGWGGVGGTMDSPGRRGGLTAAQSN